MSMPIETSAAARFPAFNATCLQVVVEGHLPGHAQVRTCMHSTSDAPSCLPRQRPSAMMTRGHGERVGCREASRAIRQRRGHHMHACHCLELATHGSGWVAPVATASPQPPGPAAALVRRRLRSGQSAGPQMHVPAAAAYTCNHVSAGPCLQMPTKGLRVLALAPDMPKSVTILPAPMRHPTAVSVMLCNTQLCARTKQAGN